MFFKQQLNRSENTLRAARERAPQFAPSPKSTFLNLHLPGSYLNSFQNIPDVFLARVKTSLQKKSPISKSRLSWIYETFRQSSGGNVPPVFSCFLILDWMHLLWDVRLLYFQVGGCVTAWKWGKKTTSSFFPPGWLSGCVKSAWEWP